MKQWITTATLAAIMMTLAACGSGENNESTDNNGTNGTTGTTGTTAPETNNTNNETTGDTTPGTTTQTTQPEPQDPYITRFEYYTSTETLGLKGYSYTVANSTIANRDGNSFVVSEEDAAEFESKVLTDDTFERMHDGWGCREATDQEIDDNGRTTFEARVFDNGESTRPTQDVSGCVLDGDTAVREVIDALDTLAAIYL